VSLGNGRLGGQLKRLLPLLYLIPVAYLMGPIFWAPLDARFFNYFQSKRPVAPWTEVAVVGIDRATRDGLFEQPTFPLSRHTHEHARIVGILDRAGARAIVFDLSLGADTFDEPPAEFADALRASGKAYLVMSLREERRAARSGDTAVLLTSSQPDSLLMGASQGAFVADVQTDSDGTVRRFDRDERLTRLGLESLSERLAGVTVERRVPIEFPSVGETIPVVSYKDVYNEDPDALAVLKGRIALVGLVDDPSTDFVTVPRLQDIGGGVEAFGLPGVVVLGAITETLIRGAPIRDASWPITLGWIVLWCVACILLMSRTRPAAAAFTGLGVIAVCLVATGFLHARADLVMPGGLVLGSLLVAGAFTLVSDHVHTAKELHAEEVENERVQKELATARETQERFLPDEIPQVEGLDVWGTNVSSLAVSGDYFDVIDLGGGKPLIFTIADVSGKGLPAALLMSNVQAGLHCHAFQGDFDLKLTAENLNRLVHRNTDPGKFVTLFLGAVDKETHLLRYVRAGHDNPILVSRDGDVRQLEEGSFVLGFIPEAEYDVAEVQLSDGDVLCLYTDGVTEARSPADQEFELDGVIRVVTEHRAESAKEIGRALLAGVRAFSQLERQADDVTLIVIKVG
jgi:serine phosphatase RsbU (regulator of sigma subunit)/CHASE2 domain-containing sensor protein